MNLSLTVLDGEFTVHRLAPDTALPAAVATACPVFLARTEDELSVVCSSAIELASQRQEQGWRCLKVEGPLDFALTGILAKLSGTLAEAGISLFAVSTFDTDYLLVRSGALDGALEALAGSGCHLDDPAV
jgi:hypothetical protein